MAVCGKVSSVAAAIPTMPRGIFISYRRQETAYAAGWLYQQLRDRFGREQIFKDVDDLDPGDDFYDKIDEAVGSCAVMLALIGDQWVDLVDEVGARRLDDPHDFVRLEIEAALRRGVRVVPLLVAGARMPRPESLPPSLSGLTRRQAVELSPERFEADTQRLLGVIERTLAEAQAVHDVNAAAHVRPAEPVVVTTSEEVPPAAGGTVTAATAPESADRSDTLPTAPSRSPWSAWAGRLTPSGIPLRVAVTLVGVAILLVWVNLPGEADTTRAWKDEDLLGSGPLRGWSDGFFWGPALALIGAVGAGRSRLLLGVTLGASAHTVATAAVILGGGLSSDQIEEWLASLVLALIGLFVGCPLRRDRGGQRARMPGAAVTAVLVGAGLVFVSDIMNNPDYTWLEVTNGASMVGVVSLLAVASPVLLDLGGREGRQTFVAAAAAFGLIGLVDLANSVNDVEPAIAGVWLAALVAYAVGVTVAAVVHSRADRSTSSGVQIESV